MDTKFSKVFASLKKEAEALFGSSVKVNHWRNPHPDPLRSGKVYFVKISFQDGFILEYGLTVEMAVKNLLRSMLNEKHCRTKEEPS